MANTNKPFGFSPWRMLDGSPWNQQTNVYYIPSTDTARYFIGDPVKSAAIMDANGVPGVTLAGGTDTVRGVIVGIYPVNPGPSTSLVGTSLALEQTAILNTTTKAQDYYVLVADGPDTMFKVQMDNGTITGSAALNTIGNKNCSFTQCTATSGAQSNAVLSAATVNTTNTLNVKLMGLINDPVTNSGVSGAGTTGQYSVWSCMFNEHELNGGTAGV